MSGETLAGVEVILRRVLDNDSLKVTRELSSWDVPEWDSVANAQLLIDVEETFGIEITAAESLRLKSIGDLVDLVDAKLSSQ